MSPSLSLHGGDLISECADRSGSVGPGWDVHIHHDKGGKLSRQVTRFTFYDESHVQWRKL